MSSKNNLNVNLFISAQCPHCASTLELLTKAVKQGTISCLNITNLSAIVDIEKYSHIRSVPFIQLQDFDFTGNITLTDIESWSEAHKNNSLTNYYLTRLFMEGDLGKAELLIKQKPAYLSELVRMAEDDKTKMQIRIGITAVFETLNTEQIQPVQLEQIINMLITACNTKNKAVRTDLVYLASLLYASLKKQQQQNTTLTGFIESLRHDSSDEIQEIIEDVL